MGNYIIWYKTRLARLNSRAIQILMITTSKAYTSNWCVTTSVDWNSGNIYPLTPSTCIAWPFVRFKSEDFVDKKDSSSTISLSYLETWGYSWFSSISPHDWVVPKWHILALCKVSTMGVLLLFTGSIMTMLLLIQGVVFICFSIDFIRGVVDRSLGCKVHYCINGLSDEKEVDKASTTNIPLDNRDTQFPSWTLDVMPYTKSELSMTEGLFTSLELTESQYYDKIDTSMLFVESWFTYSNHCSHHFWVTK